MLLFSGLVSGSASKSDPSNLKVLTRITIQLIVLAAVVGVSVTCYSRRATQALMPASDFGSPAPEIAGAYPGLEGQMMGAGQGRFQINMDVYNYQRKKQISLESAKLLSLANALSLELARHPAPPTPDVLDKIGKIEKLAHDVKSQMQENPVLGPL